MKSIFFTVLIFSCFLSSPMAGNAFQKINESFENGIEQVALPKSIDPEPFRNRLTTDLLDSSYYWKWNPATQNWMLDRRLLITYDSLNIFSYILQQYWKDTAWINNIQSFYIYDQGNLTDMTSYAWDTAASTWVNYYLMHKTFDGSFNELSNSTYYGWNGNVWTNGYYTISAYDTANNRIAQTSQRWDSLSQSWTNQGRYFCTYDSSRNLVSSVTQLWNDSTGSWINNYRQTNAYDIFNNNKYSLVERWHSITWDSLTQKFSEFDLNHNKTDELYLTWWDSAWINSRRYTYNFDANNNRTYYLSEEWDGFWFSQDENFYYFGPHHSLQYARYRTRHIFFLEDVGDYHATYDSDNHLLTSEFDYWGTGASASHYNYYRHTYDVNGNRVSDFTQDGYTNADIDSAHHYYRNPYNSIIEVSSTEFSIYPNPAVGNFTVKCDDCIITAIEIFNPLGERVYFNEVSGRSHHFIHCRLAKGIYFIKVRMGERTRVQRLVIQ